MNDNDHVNRIDPELELLRELLPAYAMGFVDEQETRQVQRLLAKFPNEAAALSDYASLSDAMLHSAPAQKPPERLLANLMQAVGEREIKARPEQQPAKVITPHFNRTLAAIAAVIVLLLVLNVFTLLQLLDLRTDQDVLQAEARDQQAMLALIARDDVARFTIEDVREADDDQRLAYGEAVAYVICNPQETIGIFYAENLPPLENDQAYQLWLVKDETRVSGGLLRPGPDGTVTYIFYAPETMRNYQYAGITTEPAAGSPGPTGSPVVRGKLYADQEAGSSWPW